MSGWRRAVAVLVAALCAVGLTAWATRTPEPPLATSGPLVLRAGSPPPPTSAPSQPEKVGEVPSAVSVPALGVRVSVIPVGVDARGEMAIPSDDRQAGWYRYGARPGATGGSAVIAAHVETIDGTGPFSLLRNAQVGQTVVVSTSSGPLRYVVYDVERIAKARLDLAVVFDRDGAPVLRLITCGGRFDASTGHYEDNVVVSAQPLP